MQALLFRRKKGPDPARGPEAGSTRRIVPMAAPSPHWPSPADAYRTPGLLSDLRLLDLLELSGSTRRAGRLLDLSQPTVSRRYRTLVSDFGLQSPAVESPACRYGSSRALQLLRLGYRSHRFEAGVARLGCDLLHQGLLEGLHWLLPTPARFRSVHHWFDLVRQGVLDGALLSELELQAASGLEPSGLELHALGALPLALGHLADPAKPPGGPPQTVLVPGGAIATGLRTLLHSQGWTLRTVAAGCHSRRQWLELLRRGACAMPMPEAGESLDGWGAALTRVSLPAGSISRVWLALPRQADVQGLLRHTLEALRRQPSLTA